ncbi:hypothetical protein Tco_0860325 [Tanacetum coccineum]|uniref:Ubiquitin hydrolase n=1 Tax=Tanacetum coccineum TaxID=301880 RepID=A0ABQ5BFF4_9ASTR
MAALVISISLDLSDESVGSSFPRVILLSSISVKVLVAPEVGEAAVASPTEIPTGPIPPAPSAVVAPYIDIISLVNAPPGICRQWAILNQPGQYIPISQLYRTRLGRPCRALTARKLVRPLPSYHLALRYTSHHMDRFTSRPSSDHSSSDHSTSGHSTSDHSSLDHSLSGHSISSHSVFEHTPPVTTIAGLSAPLMCRRSLPGQDVASRTVKLRLDEEQSNEVRKNNGAPIIEDWVSDSEEENVSQTKIEKKAAKPSFVKIDFVKAKQTNKIDRKTAKQVEYNRQNTHIPRGNQRNWDNMMSQRLGCNFEMFNKACYVCGSFDHLQVDCNYQRVIKPVWNNDKRVNH